MNEKERSRQSSLKSKDLNKENLDEGQAARRTKLCPQQLHKDFFNDKYRGRSGRICPEKHHNKNPVEYVCTEPGCGRPKVGCIFCMYKHVDKGGQKCQYQRLDHFEREVKVQFALLQKGQEKVKECEDIIFAMEQRIAEFQARACQAISALKEALLWKHHPAWSQLKRELLALNSALIEPGRELLQLTQEELVRTVNFVDKKWVIQPVHNLERLRSDWLSAESHIAKCLLAFESSLAESSRNAESLVRKSTDPKGGEPSNQVQHQDLVQNQFKKYLCYQQRKCTHSESACYYPCCNAVFGCDKCHLLVAGHSRRPSEFEYRLCLRCQSMHKIIQNGHFHCGCGM